MQNQKLLIRETGPYRNDGAAIPICVASEPVPATTATLQASPPEETIPTLSMAQ
jgi:hypothetical protein